MSETWDEQRKREHHCHAIGCVTKCKPEYLMCPRHWRMVPRTLQRMVWQSYRVGQCDDLRPSVAWFAWSWNAIRAVALREGLDDWLLPPMRVLVGRVV